MPMAAAGRRFLLLRDFGDEGFGRQHEAGDGAGVLQGGAGDLRRVEDAGFCRVFELAVGVVALRPPLALGAALQQRLGVFFRDGEQFEGCRGWAAGALLPAADSVGAYVDDAREDHLAHAEGFADFFYLFAAQLLGRRRQLRYAQGLAFAAFITESRL